MSKKYIQNTQKNKFWRIRPDLHKPEKYATVVSNVVVNEAKFIDSNCSNTALD